ncbi:MAG: FAD-linked oxidase C-terminal domain-containing protein [Pseudomonadota bacterium]
MTYETALPQRAIDDFHAVLGERFTTARGVYAEHGADISHFEHMPPDAVLFPTSTEEVARIVKTCAQLHIPIVPYGAGTSLEGHIHAMQGGVTLDMSKMNRILQVNAEDMDVAVQPGVTREELNHFLRDTGLFFPIDPGANASIGGMASTRASGTNAVRYGTMRENVHNLEVVTAAGEIIRTARRARKSAAGYDLTRLFVGAEGTLGVVTEIGLRLYGIPQAILSGVCTFDSFDGAIQSVIETIQLGVPVARAEFLDQATIRAVNHVSKLGLEVKPTLFFEFHGTDTSVEEQVEIVSETTATNGGGPFRWARKAEERSTLWAARHHAALSVPAYAPGTKQWWTDVCVPISRLAECIVETHADIESTSLFAPILGHVGDGNFHVGISAKDGDAAQFAEAEALHDRLVKRALAMDGTCTGEHGIGRGKIGYLEAEIGPGVDVMRSVKTALDPLNIMNPGKIFRA